MAEIEVPVLCYWNGTIKYGPDGVYYEGSTRKVIRVKRKTELTKLLHEVYRITGLDTDNQRSKVKIFGRYPSIVPQSIVKFSLLPVVSDASLETMLEVPSNHPCLKYVEFYLEVKSDGVTGPAPCSSTNPGSSSKRQRTDVHVPVKLKKAVNISETSSLDSLGFVSLLASQTINFDSSELPQFSSQCSDESSVKERRKWSPKEDVILIGAWLNTNKDPGAGAFWRRIKEYYNSSPLLVGTQPRERGQCKQRWAKLNDQVCKFVGCYNAALREHSSGQNDNDVMKAAYDIFYNNYGSKFTLEHAWRELRHDMKWCSTCLGKDGGKEKRKNVVDVDGQEEVTEGSSRPPSVKTAKSEAMTQLQAILELKEKISKQKLLDRLLAKTETLSEIELALKIKLMTELL